MGENSFHIHTQMQPIYTDIQSRNANAQHLFDWNIPSCRQCTACISTNTVIQQSNWSLLLVKFTNRFLSLQVKQKDDIYPCYYTNLIVFLGYNGTRLFYQVMQIMNEGHCRYNPGLTTKLNYIHILHMKYLKI